MPVQERYEAMGSALNATGRPILFSICEWGSSTPWLWAPQVCDFKLALLLSLGIYS